MANRPAYLVGPAVAQALALMRAGTPMRRAAVHSGCSLRTLQRAAKAEGIQMPRGRPASTACTG